MRRTEYAKDYEPRAASKLRVGIVVSRWNSDITERLLAGAQEILRAWHVAPKRVTVMHVAGSFEIPYVCLALIKKKKPDAVIALGCIIKGETDHDRYIASAVSHGIITANNLKQAEARATGDANKGKEAAVAALEAALLK